MFFTPTPGAQPSHQVGALVCLCPFDAHAPGQQDSAKRGDGGRGSSFQQPPLHTELRINGYQCGEQGLALLYVSPQKVRQTAHPCRGHCSSPHLPGGVNRGHEHGPGGCTASACLSLQALDLLRGARPR